MVSELAGDLPEEYRLRFGELAEYRQQVWRVLVDHWFQQYVRPEDTVLDLACGWGEFVNQVRAAKRYGLDLNTDVGRHLDPAVELLPGDAGGAWPLPDASLDVVFTSNFLEHLPDKVAVMHALREAHRCLRPGGRFVAMGPNINVLHGAYWDFFDHHTALSDLSLKEALEIRGFQVTTCLQRFLPYTMSGKKPAPLWTVRTYLKLPVLWKLLGKQFLVVAERGDAPPV